MFSLPILALAAFLLSFCLTPLVRDLFLRLGVVDRPDHSRKLHLTPVPRVGGLPILAAFAGSFAVLLLAPFRDAGLPAYGTPLVWKILPAVTLVFLTGLADDIIGLKPWHKLLAECAAAGWVWWMGLRVLGTADYTAQDWWSMPLTIAWFIGCTNALNLIDGVDGLAAGLGLFATVTMLIAALLQNNVHLAMAVVPLAGALLGFLRYNFNPASIFLGDCGSLSLGFLLGCYGVIWSQKSATFLGMTAPLMVLAIPLLDVLLSVVRRFLRGQPISQADRGHIHHRLLDRGLTPRRAVLLLYGACGLFAGLSLFGSMVRNQYAGLVIVPFCAVTWIGIQKLGCEEFSIARRMLLGGAFQSMINAQILLRTFESRLAAAETVDDCWAAIHEACGWLGFNHVELRLAGRTFAQRIEDSNGHGSWDLHVPLTNGDYIHLTREFRRMTQTAAIVPLVESLRAALPGKDFLSPVSHSLS